MSRLKIRERDHVAVVVWDYTLFIRKEPASGCCEENSSSFSSVNNITPPCPILGWSTVSPKGR